MKKIITPFKNTIVEEREDELVYIFEGEEYVSVNGEDEEGNISLILKSDFDNEMSKTIELIDSTDALIERLKNG